VRTLILADVKSKYELPGKDFSDSETKEPTDDICSNIPLDTALTLYNDKQFFPATFHATIAKLINESDRKIRRKIISGLRNGILILPFLLDYITDIINSGTVKINLYSLAGVGLFKTACIYSQPENRNQRIRTFFHFYGQDLFLIIPVRYFRIIFLYSFRSFRI